MFRSPYGARCQKLNAFPNAAEGLIPVGWNVDPQEWRQHGVEQTFAYVQDKLASLGPGQRAIVLLHDTKTHAVKALPKILAWLAAENANRPPDTRITVVDHRVVLPTAVPLPGAPMLSGLGDIAAGLSRLAGVFR